MTTSTTPLKPGTTDQWVIAQLESGEPVIGVEVPGTKVSDTEMIVTPTTPLPENAAFSAFEWAEYLGTYRTTTETDDVAPSRPEVVGGSVNFHDGTGACTSDSCGDYTYASIRLKALATDDLTTTERIVYAVYLGTSRQEAQTKSSADALYAGASYSLQSDLSMSENIGDEWLDHDVFVAVAAIDQSGNLSERSTPVQIHSGDSGGCAMRAHRRHARVSTGIFIAIALFSGWLRRRKRD